MSLTANVFATSRTWCWAGGSRALSPPATKTAISRQECRKIPPKSNRVRSQQRLNLGVDSHDIEFTQGDAPMGYRVIAAGCITASLFLAGTVASSLAQSQLPRPGQLPPAGGQQGGQQQTATATAATAAGRAAATTAAAGPAAPAAGTASAAAEPPRRSPTRPVAITAPPMVNDPSFEAFRKQMGAAAEKKDRKALADMVSKTFFWMGEKGDTRRQEAARHRKSRQSDRARRQGRLRLGSAAELRRRSDRHAVPGAQGHDLRAGRAAVRLQGA